MAGGELKPRRFTRIRTLRRLEELLKASTPAEPTQSTFHALQKQFAEQESSILAAVKARSQERLEFLTNTLDRRRRAEESEVVQILKDLDAMIRKELTESGKAVQLQLWPAHEREQLRRDIEALRARLERIPEEREREITTIQRRYADPVDRTFPVAVGFLVPEGGIYP